jgi:hypothetical protein
MLVIDGKYNSGDGRIRRIKSLGDSDVKAQEEQALRKTRASKAQDTGVCRGEGRQRSSSRWIPSKISLDLVQGRRQPSDLQKLRGR